MPPLPSAQLGTNSQCPSLKKENRQLCLKTSHLERGFKTAEQPKSPGFVKVFSKGARGEHKAARRLARMLTKTGSPYEFSMPSTYFGEGDRWRKGRCDELDSFSCLQLYILFRKSGCCLRRALAPGYTQSRGNLFLVSMKQKC